MNDPEERTTVAELLKFFSNKANTHASFVVAELFGFYTVLSSAKMLGLALFFWTGLFLLIINLYSFANFMQYSSLASNFRGRLAGHYWEEHKEEIYRSLEERSKFLEVYSRIRTHPLFDKIKIYMLAFIWGSTVVLPFIVVLLFFPV